ncbi:WD40 repeat-like protein [Pleomassaria siparia CBS 279.74]|uniref:WD40 repeat-like protein n=1 Tax=Pleomassaria siparia CBS 279.74 TaxID=1314801 RepID=A0A6G1K3E0_9PLEO|nr:WD40 repeat-like protein [Pleomassaria siparia CBS 279.74]
MAQRSAVKTTYVVGRTLQPIYSGGSVALSADGRVLAACLGEDALLTDLTTGKELARIEGDGEVITALALTPSASHLIVCSRSLSMRIYSLLPSEDDTLECEQLRSLKPHTSPVVTLQVDSTGTLLATGGADGIVKVWDIRGGYITHTFHGHGGVVSALHFFQVEVPKEDDTAQGKKRKRKSKQEEADVANGEGSVEYRLACGAEDGKIRIWNLHKKNSSVVLDSHVSVVRSLQFSSQHNILISGSRDKTVIMWDARTWKIKRTIAALEGIESVGFVCGGQIIFSGGENGRIRLWTAENGTELTPEQEAGNETDAIVDILHHASLPYLISVQADQVLNFHSLQSLDSTVVQDTIQPLPIFRRVSGTHDEVIDLTYVGSDKSLLALNTNSEDIRIVTLKSSDSNDEKDAIGGKYFGADVAFLSGHEDIVICMDVDWSGHWLATGAKDNTARLWRLDPQNDSFGCFAVLTGHAESLGAIALPHTPPPTTSPAFTDPLSHPPDYLVTGSQDRTVKRWDISKDGKRGLRAKYTRKAHDKDINAIDIDPTATLFASASQDRTVKIYSAAEGEAIGVLRGHRRGVWTVKFAPKDSQLPGSSSKGLVATGSGDKTVKIWSLSDYSCLLTLEGHSNSVLKLAWIPYRPIDTRDKRGAQLASAAGDGLVKVWDTSSGEAMTTLDNHTDRVWALAAHPTSGTLVSGGADSVVTFWDDTTSSTLEAATVAETERVELEQKLQNYTYSGNYREAITLALQMDQPGRLFALFKSVVETEAPEEGSLSGLTAVDDVLGHLGDEQLYTLLLRLRDWNTNVRSAPIAQKILWTVVKSYPASRLASLKPAGKVGAKGSLKDVLDAVKAYSERHYRRVEELVDESYLLDFTLQEMDEVADVKSITNGTSRLGLNQDVVMVE